MHWQGFCLVLERQAGKEFDMSVDVIGNMLTTIRNACGLSKKTALIPHSKFKENVLTVLRNSGYIRGFEVVPSKESQIGKDIKIELKYVDGESVIHKIERVSSPGVRIYKKPAGLKPVIGGLGISVISTSKGVMSDIQARKMSLGGEVLLEIW